MRAGRPWNATCFCASGIQRCSRGSSGNSSSTASSVAAMSAGSPDSAAQRNGPLPTQNSGRMYSGTKPGIRKRALAREPALDRLAAQVVAVVEHARAPRVFIVEHARAPGRPSSAARGARTRSGSRRAQRRGLLERQPGGHVAVQRIVRRGLIGHEIGRDAALHELRDALRPRCRRARRSAVASRADRLAAQRASASSSECASVVAVARRDAALRARLVDFDAEAHAAVHGDRERLRAAHAAESRRQHEPARERCRRSGARRSRRRSRTCPARCPASRCRSTSPPSSGRTS